ncbi:MAG TPA: TetR/AcrR family transcriptional regulator, partial [Acidimicrobiales bacterium]|nr:TetR/AcrR family transcriptional regulator [Acidimicrobiales bacterium]
MPRLSRAEQRARTVEALLDAAEGEFRRLGYHSVTVEAVAERAGFTRGAVYGNFPSGKPDLFLAVAERSAARYVGRVSSAINELDDAGFAEAYLALRARARADVGWGRAQLEFALVAAHDPELRERYAALRRSIVDRVEAGFRPVLRDDPAISPRELATVAVALEQGLDVARWLDPDAVADDLEHRVIEHLG